MDNTSLKALMDGTSWATCADNLNHLRHTYKTLRAFHKREEDPQEKQYLADLISHAEAMMEFMFRHSIERDPIIRDEYPDPAH